MFTFKQYLNEVANPSTPSTSYGGGKITENHNGVRRLPLSSALKTAIANGLAGSGLDWRSFSGGQPPSGPNRVGSHRHDNGNGSDGEFVESGTGRTLNADNPQDRQKIAGVLAKLKANGVKGFGWDSSSTGAGHYMGSSRFHLDVAGPPGVWGSSKRSNTAASWIITAIGGTPQGEVVGDIDDGVDGVENMPPGQGENQPDYDSPQAALQGLAQGVDLAFGSGMYQ